MAQVVWTRVAQIRVRQIHRYIARNSPSAAGNVVRRLRAEAARLANYPQRGRMVPEYDDVTIRELIVPPYRVMYRYQLGSDTVEIVAVVHGSRALPRLTDQ